MFYDYQILEITDGNLKKKYTEQILRMLPEWFGVEESLVEYIETVDKYPFFGAFKKGECVGFFSKLVYESLRCPGSLPIRYRHLGGSIKIFIHKQRKHQLFLF